MTIVDPSAPLLSVAPDFAKLGDAFDQALADINRTVHDVSAEIDRLRAHNLALLDALEAIEGLLCDKALCGHFTPDEIRAVIASATETLQ